MRTAPLFRLEAATSRPWRRVLLGTWLATGAVIAGWLVTAWLWNDLDGLRGLTAALAATVWLLARPDTSAPRIALAWDGLGWQWDDAPQRHAGPPTEPQPRPCDLSVTVDLDAWLLLRLRPLYAGPGWRARVHWVALSESDVGPHWHSLRCALYSARRMTDPVPSPTTSPPTEGRPEPR